MADPYETLGISPDADEVALRKRYLELVRQYSPEKSPERFAQIREAYEQLRDPLERLARQVFQVHSGETLDDVIADLRAREQAARIPTETLLSLAER
jgi:curved DNA-binding protein CbpA